MSRSMDHQTILHMSLAGATTHRGRECAPVAIMKVITMMQANAYATAPANALDSRKGEPPYSPLNNPPNGDGSAVLVRGILSMLSYNYVATDYSSARQYPDNMLG